LGLDESAAQTTGKKTAVSRADQIGTMNRLYSMSTVHQRQDRDSEAYWFERNGAECTFRPDLSKPGAPGGLDNDTALAIPGAGKQVERLTRGRKEAAFKKMMTERSAYSPTKPAKTARPATARGPIRSF